MVDILGALAFLLPAQAYFTLGIHSIYKATEEEKEQVEKETRRQLKSNLQVLEEQFWKIVSQKQITYTVALVTLVAGIAWAIDTVAYAGWYIPVWPISLALVETLVLFFAIQTVYHSTSKWLLPSLRNNKTFDKIITWTTFLGALILSVTSTVGCIYTLDLPCTVEGYLNDLANYLFFIILFITGLGSIGIVDTISNSLSSHIPAEKRLRVGFYSVFLASFTLLYFILGQTTGLGATGAYGRLGLELALFVGLGCLIYWLVRGRVVRTTSLVYIVLMVALSGLFIGYSLSSISPPNLNSPNIPLTDSLRMLAIPLMLFAVGYIAILFHLPRALEQRLGLAKGKIVPYLTFLLVFTALASYQIADFSFGPGIFFVQKEVPVFLGLQVGAVLFVTRKVTRAKRRGVLKTSSIVPFCENCWSRLPGTSKFCENCGSPLTTRPEKIFFVSDGELIGIKGRHHSTRRKVASLMVGGPMGYLAFGRDVTRKPEIQGQLAVTDKAVYIGGDYFPLNGLVSVRNGNYSDSIILEMKRDVHQGPSLPTAQKTGSTRAEVELKTSDPTSFSRSIEQAIREESPETTETKTK